MGRLIILRSFCAITDTSSQVRQSAIKLKIKPNSVSIGGLSAGGHMTAVLSHIAKQERVDLKLALMIVPSVDLRWAIAEEPLRSEVAKKYPSVSMIEHSPWSPRSREEWFMNYWIPEGKCPYINDSLCILTNASYRIESLCT